MKLNKHGCRRSGDVCVEHCLPLLCEHGCVEAIHHKCKTIKIDLDDFLNSHGGKWAIFDTKKEKLSSIGMMFYFIDSFEDAETALIEAEKYKDVSIDLIPTLENKHSGSGL